ncbi:MAG: hypothetical protein KDB07_00920, partial [Planctomycetes bacterium]|nr:hypothetical protein [Planctomycetota bacterium]
EALGMRFDMPSGWLCDLSGGEILLRGSWRNGRAPTINLRWVNTTIDDEVGQAAYLRSARDEIIEAHGGLLEVSDLSERFFGPHFGAEIEAQSKNTERPSRTWMVAFCSKRILTLVLVGPDDATKQSARALIASLAKGAN